MLNSRYAPVVALTVLAIILVVVLGWFLAIKPQIDERASIRETTAEVVANTEKIDLESARLDEYAREFDLLPDYSPLIATHSPEGFDVEVVRTRLTDAIRGADAEIVSLEHGELTEIEGWALPAAVLPSSHIAKLFQTGPVHVATEGDLDTEGDQSGQAAVFEPVVTVAADGEATSVFYGMPITVGIAGTAPELLRVLELLEDADQQLFQLYALEFEQRPEGSPPIDGVAEAVDGDGLLYFTGFFYLEGVPTELTDEGEVGGIGLGGSDPFNPIEGNVDQPGAN